MKLEVYRQIKFEQMASDLSRAKLFVPSFASVVETTNTRNTLAQSTRAAEYTDCKECSGYDTKQSDGEAPLILELWGMQSAPSLPSLSGPLWPRVVALDRVLSMDQIELNSVIMLN